MTMEADEPDADETNSLQQILSGSYVPALDGLRALAVFTVIIYHFGLSSVPGDLGVIAFFVLSGFLITWLLLKEQRQTGDISLKNFYLRRTLRIFPAYYVFLAFAFLQEYWRGYQWKPGLLEAGLLYVVNYYNAFNGHPTTVIAHAWSLAIEEQFYLLWPALFLVLSRFGKLTITWALVGIISGVAIWRSWLLFGLGASKSYLYNAFDTRFDNIAIGCLLVVCLDWPWFVAVIGSTARYSLLPLVTLALLMWSRIGGSDAYHYSIGLSIDALLLGVFMLQLVQLHSTRLWSWLETSIIRYLGRISYSLYLYHIFGLGMGRRLTNWPLWGQLVAGLIFCVAFASVSYWGIERLFLKFKRRFAVITVTVASRT